MRTAFTEEYELDLPVASAGMAFVARAELVAAVSAAGGMGVLGGTAMPPALLEQEIAAVRASTDRCFGVNFIPRFCESDHIALSASLRVPVVSFFWDNPDRAWVDELHAAGTRVWMQVGSVDEAVDAVEMGADLVIAQGIEAGGHNRSTAGTFCLVPAVVDAIAPVPVLAAGGIADGRGVVAAIALGADGAWIGTRFLASAEADAHRDYKARLVDVGVDATARHWVFGLDFPDAPVRGLRNRIVVEHEGADRPPPYERLDLASLPVIGNADVFGQTVPLVKYTGLPPTARATGDLEQMSLLAGESAGLIGAVLPAREITSHLAQEIDATLRDRIGDSFG
ncbi:MAG: nitronate monooxygenase [bacterium]|nr:nitronate monooxygenase [bacterium]